MAKLKGIPIILIDKLEVGKDPFGNQIFEEKEITVENVLISPASSDDIVNNLSLTGRKAVYTLAIPKGDLNEWENKEVRFFGQKWRVFGKPLEGLEHLIPLDWNKKVMVEVYE